MVQDNLVSVIVPSFNHARYLRKRLDSILSQDYPNYELLVVDDASTDGSAGILNEYSNRPRTRIIVRNERQGVFRNWREGLERTSGEYIWIAESDDYADPSFLSRLVSVLQDPEIGLAYCNSWLVDEDDRSVGLTSALNRDLSTTRWLNPYKNSGDREVRSVLAIRNTIPNASSVVFKRAILPESALDAAANFDLCGDWYIWIEILRATSIAYVPVPLNYFRTNLASTVRGRMQGTARRIEEQLKIYEHLSRNFDLSPAVIGRMKAEAVRCANRDVLRHNRSLSCLLMIFSVFNRLEPLGLSYFGEYVKSFWWYIKRRSGPLFHRNFELLEANPPGDTRL